MNAGSALLERERRLGRARLDSGTLGSKSRVSTRGAARAKPLTARDETGPKAVGAWKAGLLVTVLVFGALAWIAPREDAEAVLESSRRGAAPEGDDVSAAFAAAADGHLRAAVRVDAARGEAARVEGPVVAASPRVSVLAEKDFLGSVASSEPSASQASAAGHASDGALRAEAAVVERYGGARSAASARERPAAREPGAKRRTSVAVREEAPKPPPPKPSVIVEQPRALYRPKPTYPASAQKDGTTGAVRVRLFVTAQGTMEKYEILDARPPGVFEDAVKEVLPHWTMAPAKDDAGVKVPCPMEFTFVFDLKSGS